MKTGYNMITMKTNHSYRNQLNTLLFHLQHEEWCWSFKWSSSDIMPCVGELYKIRRSSNSTLRNLYLWIMQGSVVLVSTDFFFPDSLNIMNIISRFIKYIVCSKNTVVDVIINLPAYLNSLLGLDIYDEHSVQHWLGGVYKLILYVHSWSPNTLLVVISLYFWANFLL